MKREGERTFECTIAVMVRVTASGYYDHGMLSGTPDHCYPPEGECDISEIQVIAPRPKTCGALRKDDLDTDATEAIETAFYKALEDYDEEHE